MITQKFAEQFAEEWADAMNKQDFEKISVHYDENVEVTSPMILLASDEQSETMRGINKIIKYWKDTFKRIPDLRFGMYEFFTSVNSVAIYYRAFANKRACEIFYFNDQGKIVKSVTHFN